MSRRLVSYDPFTKTQTWHYYDAATDQTHIEHVQDVQSILDRNKGAANSGINNKKGDYWHFATIPNSVILKLKKEKGIDVYNKDDLKKLEVLIQRDPEWRYLRTY